MAGMAGTRGRWGTAWSLRPLVLGPTFLVRMITAISCHTQWRGSLCLPPWIRSGHKVASLTGAAPYPCSPSAAWLLFCALTSSCMCACVHPPRAACLWCACRRAPSSEGSHGLACPRRRRRSCAQASRTSHSREIHFVRVCACVCGPAHAIYPTSRADPSRRCDAPSFVAWGVPLSASAPPPTSVLYVHQS